MSLIKFLLKDLSNTKKKAIKLFFILFIPIFIILGISSCVENYKISKEIYIVVNDVNVLMISKNGLEKIGTIKAQKKIYRIKHFEVDYLPEYFYVDVDYIHRGSLSGFVKKEDLKKIPTKTK